MSKVIALYNEGSVYWMNTGDYSKFWVKRPIVEIGKYTLSII